MEEAAPRGSGPYAELVGEAILLGYNRSMRRVCQNKHGSCTPSETMEACECIVNDRATHTSRLTPRHRDELIRIVCLDEIAPAATVESRRSQLRVLSPSDFLEHTETSAPWSSCSSPSVTSYFTDRQVSSFSSSSHRPQSSAGFNE
ncbi:uncharacterized [Tachysurus ichikawai]